MVISNNGDKSGYDIKLLVTMVTKVGMIKMVTSCMIVFHSGNHGNIRYSGDYCLLTYSLSYKGHHGRYHSFIMFI